MPPRGVDHSPRSNTSGPLPPPSAAFAGNLGRTGLNSRSPRFAHSPKPQPQNYDVREGLVPESQKQRKEQTVEKESKKAKKESKKGSKSPKNKDGDGELRNIVQSSLREEMSRLEGNLDERLSRVERVVRASSPDAGRNFQRLEKSLEEKLQRVEQVINASSSEGGAMLPEESLQTRPTDKKKEKDKKKDKQKGNSLSPSPRHGAAKDWTYNTREVLGPGLSELSSARNQYLSDDALDELPVRRTSFAEAFEPETTTPRNTETIWPKDAKPAVSLHFPNAQWPAHPRFERELRKSLARLGANKAAAGIVVRLRRGGGVMAELLGSVGEVDELREAALEELVVLQYPVDDVRWNPEVADVRAAKAGRDREVEYNLDILDSGEELEQMRMQLSKSRKEAKGERTVQRGAEEDGRRKANRRKELERKLKEIDDEIAKRSGDRERQKRQLQKRRDVLLKESEELQRNLHVQLAAVERELEELETNSKEGKEMRLQYLQATKQRDELENERLEKEAQRAAELRALEDSLKKVSKSGKKIQDAKREQDEIQKQKLEMAMANEEDERWFENEKKALDRKIDKIAKQSKGNFDFEAKREELEKRMDVLLRQIREDKIKTEKEVEQLRRQLVALNVDDPALQQKANLERQLDSLLQEEHEVKGRHLLESDEFRDNGYSAELMLKFEEEKNRHLDEKKKLEEQRKRDRDTFERKLQELEEAQVRDREDMEKMISDAKRHGDKIAQREFLKRRQEKQELEWKIRELEESKAELELEITRREDVAMRVQSSSRAPIVQRKEDEPQTLVDSQAQAKDLENMKMRLQQVERNLSRTEAAAKRQNNSAPPNTNLSDRLNLVESLTQEVKVEDGDDPLALRTQALLQALRRLYSAATSASSVISLAPTTKQLADEMMTASSRSQFEGELESPRHAYKVKPSAILKPYSRERARRPEGAYTQGRSTNDQGTQVLEAFPDDVPSQSPVTVEEPFSVPSFRKADVKRSAGPKPKSKEEVLSIMQYEEAHENEDQKQETPRRAEKKRSAGPKPKLKEEHYEEEEPNEDIASQRLGDDSETDSMNNVERRNETQQGIVRPDAATQEAQEIEARDNVVTSLYSWGADATSKMRDDEGATIDSEEAQQAHERASQSDVNGSVQSLSSRTASDAEGKREQTSQDEKDSIDVRSPPRQTDSDVDEDNKEKPQEEEFLVDSDVEELGMRTTVPPGEVVVTHLTKGGWADTSDIRKRDKVISVNGTEAATMKKDVFLEAFGRRPLRLVVVFAPAGGGSSSSERSDERSDNESRQSQDRSIEDDDDNEDRPERDRGLKAPRDYDSDDSDHDRSDLGSAQSQQSSQGRESRDSQRSDESRQEKRRNTDSEGGGSASSGRSKRTSVSVWYESLKMKGEWRLHFKTMGKLLRLLHSRISQTLLPWTLHEASFLKDCVADVEAPTAPSRTIVMSVCHGMAPENASQDSDGLSRTSVQSLVDERIQEFVADSDVDELGMMTTVPPGEVFVTNLTRGGWADRSDIRKHDEIRLVNGTEAAKMQEGDFLDAFGRRPLRLMVAFAVVGGSSSSERSDIRSDNDRRHSHDRSIEDDDYKEDRLERDHEVHTSGSRQLDQAQDGVASELDMLNDSQIQVGATLVCNDPDVEVFESFQSHKVVGLVIAGEKVTIAGKGVRVAGTFMVPIQPHGVVDLNAFKALPQHHSKSVPKVTGMASLTDTSRPRSSTRAKPKSRSGKTTASNASLVVSGTVLLCEVSDDEYAEVFEETYSNEVIGLVAAGENVTAAGPATIVDEVVMVPIEPKGAVELQHFKFFPSTSHEKSEASRKVLPSISSALQDGMSEDTQEREPEPDDFEDDKFKEEKEQFELQKLRLDREVDVLKKMVEAKDVALSSVKEALEDTVERHKSAAAAKIQLHWRWRAALRENDELQYILLKQKQTSYLEARKREIEKGIRKKRAAWAKDKEEVHLAIRNAELIQQEERAKARKAVLDKKCKALDAKLEKVRMVAESKMREIEEIQNEMQGIAAFRERSAIKIQSWWRGQGPRRDFRKIQRIRRVAARRIQSARRRQLMRRLVWEVLRKRVANDVEDNEEEARSHRSHTTDEDTNNTSDHAQEESGPSLTKQVVERQHISSPHGASNSSGARERDSNESGPEDGVLPLCTVPRGETHRMKDPEGDWGSFHGPLNNQGQADGKGTLVYDDGDSFVGRFIDGVMLEGVCLGRTGKPKFTMKNHVWSRTVDMAIVDKYLVDSVESEEEETEEHVRVLVTDEDLRQILLDRRQREIRPQRKVRPSAEGLAIERMKRTEDNEKTREMRSNSLPILKVLRRRAARIDKTRASLQRWHEKQQQRPDQPHVRLLLRLVKQLGQESPKAYRSWRANQRVAKLCRVLDRPRKESGARCLEGSPQRRRRENEKAEQKEQDERKVVKDAMWERACKWHSSQHGPQSLSPEMYTRLCCDHAHGNPKQTPSASQSRGVPRDPFFDHLGDWLDARKNDTLGTDVPDVGTLISELASQLDSVGPGFTGALAQGLRWDRQGPPPDSFVETLHEDATRFKRLSKQLETVMTQLPAGTSGELARLLGALDSHKDSEDGCDYASVCLRLRALETVTADRDVE